MKSLLVSLTAATLLTGCVSVRNMQPTTINLEPSVMEVVGPAEGESSRIQVFGFGGAPSLTDALKDATRKQGSQALINTCADEMVDNYFFWIVQGRTVRVSGVGVRFKPKP